MEEVTNLNLTEKDTDFYNLRIDIDVDDKKHIDNIIKSLRVFLRLAQLETITLMDEKELLDDFKTCGALLGAFLFCHPVYIHQNIYNVLLHSQPFTCKKNFKCFGK